MFRLLHHVLCGFPKGVCSLLRVGGLRKAALARLIVYLFSCPRHGGLDLMRNFQLWKFYIIGVGRGERELHGFRSSSTQLGRWIVEGGVDSPGFYVRGLAK